MLIVGVVQRLSVNQSVDSGLILEHVQVLQNKFKIFLAHGLVGLTEVNPLIS